MRNKHIGYSLVEIIVIIATISVLAGIIYVSYSSWSTKTVTTQLKSDLSNVANAMENHRTFNNTYPTNIPSTFAASSDVTLAGGGTNGDDDYCVDANKGSLNYFISSKYSDPQPGKCPLAYLDASIKSSYNGTGTIWNDISGSANNATLANGVAYNTSNNGVFTFDGVNDRAVLPNDIGLASQELTVVVWVKQTVAPAALTGSAFVSDWNTWAPGTQKGFLIRTYNTSTTPVFIVADGTNYYSVNSSDAMVLGSWYQVAGVFKANTTFKIYLNGVQKGTVAAPTQYLKESTTPVYLGYGGINVGYFTGQIGAVYISDSAWSVEDINNNFESLRSRFGI